MTLALHSPECGKLKASFKGFAMIFVSWLRRLMKNMKTIRYCFWVRNKPQPEREIWLGWQPKGVLREPAHHASAIPSGASQWQAQRSGRRHQTTWGELCAERTPAAIGLAVKGP
jgi:hypothetical protein